MGKSPDCLRCERLVTLIERAIHTMDSSSTHRVILNFKTSEDFLEFVRTALVAREGGAVCTCRTDPLRGGVWNPGCPKHPTSPYADKNAPAEHLDAVRRLVEAATALLRFFDSVRPGGRVLASDPDIDAARAAIADLGVSIDRTDMGGTR